ncbi:uncharacterized protein AruCF_4994 [Achromobacter ruhlandii]|nr:uncharacterized protein AruCF_4994 [Achromobacter ruhlandii]
MCEGGKQAAPRISYCRANGRDSAAACRIAWRAAAGGRHDRRRLRVTPNSRL